MTREKIIQGLYKGDSRAIKEAIKALEKEPCEDAISRRAVLDIIKFEENWLFYAKSNNADTDIAFSGIRTQVAKLSPVTSAQKWIPVSKRLPENNEVYLVTIIFDIDETESGRDVTKAYFCSQSKKWQYFSNDEVIAWMPLPEPYKVEMESEEWQDI